MLNPRLAGRYAKSVLDLAVERGELSIVNDDMRFLLAVCKSNRDFIALLRSPVITPDKKRAIVEAVTKGRISDLTNSFNALLIKKGRESYLPEIAEAFIEQYNAHEEIYPVKLTTAHPISEALKQEIVDKVKSESNRKTIELTTEVNEDLIGGFVLQIGNQLVDASIAYDLNNIRKQFLNNDFIYKIR